MRALADLSRRAVERAVPAGLERRFLPAAACDLDAVIELRVTDATGRRGARYAICVSQGRCTVTRRAAPEAGARVSIAAGDALALVTGRARWPALLAQRRLRLVGDPFLALRFPTLFGFVRSR